VKVRFQADADLNEILVKAVLRREPGIEFLTAQAVGLAGLTDRDVLTVAAKSDRVLVTHDRRTMPKHFAEFIATERSAGVLIVPQRMPIMRAAEELILVWAATEAEEWFNRIWTLPL
jgi:hypothetical protein